MNSKLQINLSLPRSNMFKLRDIKWDMYNLSHI